MILLDLKRKAGALNSMGILMKKGGKGAFILKKKIVYSLTLFWFCSPMDLLWRNMPRVNFLKIPRQEWFKDITWDCPAGIYLFKVNNGNTRTIWEILMIDTSEQHQWRNKRPSVIIVNFNSFMAEVPII